MAIPSLIILWCRKQRFCKRTFLFFFSCSIGKRLLREGDIAGALAAFEKATDIQPDERLLSKISKMKDYLAANQDEQEEDGSGMVELGKGFYIFEGIEKKLYAYQRDGIIWMWELYLKKRGGVLGDDMGLGKTIQVVAFLSGMFDANLVNSVLLVMPVSLIPNWKKEFEAWAPGIRVFDFHTGSKKERERNLVRVQRRGGVLLTSYGMVQNNQQELCSRDGRQFVWCYLILDEGHKIKNPTKTTKAVCEVPAKHRLVLTGTAIQNNLRELWALFNFAQQGALLGSLATFKMQYETSINRAREKDATVGERMLGIEIAKSLRQKIKPYFLRRTKAEVLENKENTTIETDSLRPKLCFTSKKNDLVVWVYLADVQKTIYREFLESEEVANILMTKKSPLVQLTVLKKICDHPRLLSKRACVQMGMYDNMTQEQIEEFLEKEEGNSMGIDDVTDETLLNESGKMTFVLSLLVNLRAEGHRTLLFSQSRKILDIIQRILIHKGFEVTRLDGTVTKMVDRDRLVNKFQNRATADVFLLTTQVGGVGLTLTAADRVVIYDPSWNPATDAQAVDRAYRIGQQKNVVVYRLVTCSTVEEKIYRRQIFKDSIIKQTTGKQRDPTRYFTKQELRELFTLENPLHSATQVQLSEMHIWNKDADRSLDAHIRFLETKNIFGVSHHDLMFTEEADDAEEFVPGELEHVQRRVEMADRMVTIEADMALDEIQNKENYTVPMNIVVKTRVPGSFQTARPNLLPIVIDDEPVEVKENKRVTILSDDADEAVSISNLDSINRSLAGLTVQGNKDDSILVPDSDDDLFPEEDEENGGPIEIVNEHSLIIESDEDTSPRYESSDRRAGSLTRVMKEEQCGNTSVKKTQQKSSFVNLEAGTNMSPPASKRNTEYAEERAPRSDISHISPAVKIARSLSGKSCTSSVKEETEATVGISYTGSLKTVQRCLSFSDDVEESVVTRENASHYTPSAALEVKREQKKRLRDSPWMSPVERQAKHAMLSPSVLKVQPGSPQQTNFSVGTWAPPKFQSSPITGAFSPARQLEEHEDGVPPSSSSPCTPSKRIIPLLLNSPLQSRRSSFLKAPASPFQKALAESRELSPPQSPRPTSRRPRKSTGYSEYVHALSSSDEDGRSRSPEFQKHLDSSRVAEDRNSHSLTLHGRSIHTVSSSDEDEGGDTTHVSKEQSVHKVNVSSTSDDGSPVPACRRQGVRILSDEDESVNSAPPASPQSSATDYSIVTSEESEGEVSEDEMWQSISCSTSSKVDDTD